MSVATSAMAAADDTAVPVSGRSRWRRRAGLLLRYAILIAVALVFAFPIVFMLVSSLKPDLQLLTDTASLRAFLPVGDISLDNYFAAFRRAPVALFIFNSVLVTTVTVVLSLLVCSLAGFSFAFLDWRGRDVVLTIIIATLVVPFETIAIPLLMVVNSLPWVGAEGLTFGWLNSYHVQIVPWIADGLTSRTCHASSSKRPASTARAGSTSTGASSCRSPGRSLRPRRSSNSSLCTTSTSGR
jgi:ABC-type glycerol-3-phosphate transport system permease component